MSKGFRLVLFIRFLGHLIFFIGLVALLSVFGPILKSELDYRIDQLRGTKHIVPTIITSSPQPLPSGSFGNLGVTAGEIITPVSTEFGIVIEKINANSPVVANVNPGNEAEYVRALSLGVAHAAGTNFPGERGNIYLFSHSTDAPWNAVRYNAVFYLLRELEVGDRVVLFFKDRRYDYLIFDKVVVAATDLSYLTNVYEQSVLTLQTCDPPGTLFKRLIIRAKLVGS